MAVGHYCLRRKFPVPCGRIARWLLPRRIGVYATDHGGSKPFGSLAMGNYMVKGCAILLSATTLLDVGRKLAGSWPETWVGLPAVASVDTRRQRFYKIDKLEEVPTCKNFLRAQGVCGVNRVC